MSHASLVDQMRERARVLGISLPDDTPPPAYDDDLIPDIGEYKPGDDDVALDAFLDGIRILDAYDRWCGKPRVPEGSKRESIMVSCPNPSHPDKNPSAWINLDKGAGGVGTCAVCGGFDKYTIAGYYFGLDPHSDFRELRYRMAQDYGYVITRSAGGEWVTPESETAPAKISANVDAVTTYVPTVTTTFDWESVPALTEDSFLREWMNAHARQYEPAEFYFALGLVALGSAIGNNVRLSDTPPVRGNLMVCLVAPSGAGKSISVNSLLRLLENAFPWDNDSGLGVKQMTSPGSGEALVDDFVHYVDEVDPVPLRRQVPVNGLLIENEFALLAAKTRRSGSTMRERIMDFYDGRPVEINSRTSGKASARDHFMQLVSTTQNASIGRVMSKSDMGAGFLNRWIYVYGQAKKRPLFNKNPLDLSESERRIRRVRAWGSKDRMIEVSEAAAALAEAFYDEHIYPRMTSEDIELGQRMDLLFKKLLLLFASNMRTDEVTVEAVESVITIWPFLVAGFNATEEHVGHDELSHTINLVVRYLQEHADQSLYATEIHARCTKKTSTLPLTLKALDTLVSAGDVEQVFGKRGKTPKYQWIKDER